MSSSAQAQRCKNHPSRIRDQLARGHYWYGGPGCVISVPFVLRIQLECNDRRTRTFIPQDLICRGRPDPHPTSTRACRRPALVITPWKATVPCVIGWCQVSASGKPSSFAILSMPLHAHALISCYMSSSIPLYVHLLDPSQHYQPGLVLASAESIYLAWLVKAFYYGPPARICSKLRP